jgi:hypothetical protein
MRQIDFEAPCCTVEYEHCVVAFWPGD